MMHRHTFRIACGVALLACAALYGSSDAIVQQQPPSQPSVDGEPYIVDTYVDVIGIQRTRIAQLWSDGKVTLWIMEREACVADFFGVVVEPVNHTAPALRLYRGIDGPNGSWLIAFADGRMDSTFCGTIMGDDGLAYCTGDVDYNGAVEFDDLLALLSNWGDCPQ